MPKVIGKRQLCKTDRKHFKAFQGVINQLLIDRFQQIEIIVNKYINSKFQYFISHPVKEDDGDKIVWHGIKYNETPKLLSELSGEEFDKYSKIKEETLKHFESIINKLKHEDKAVEAEYLTKSIKFIDDNFVFCYGDCVVLTAWGMTLKDNLQEPIGEIRVKLFKKIVVDTPALEPIPSPEPQSSYNIVFSTGSQGVLAGALEIKKEANEFLTEDDIPTVEPKDGYEFVGWSEDPKGFKVNDDNEFEAQYREIELTPPPPLPPIVLPWYKRFWYWLLGLSIWRWLKWLLLIILLFLLFSWLFRSCRERTSNSHVGIPGRNDSVWVEDDPNVSDDGGIYDPVNPYNPIPTPPEYDGILPPEQGVMPPVDGEPEIIPGNPTILGNRLNILLLNETKSVMELAKAFKDKYPDSNYKVVYYDNTVKRIQIQIPKEERVKLKEEIPNKFAPDFELFVFDESLFEGRYIPNDPAFSSKDKIWYLNAINAQKAWDITRGSKDIKVAIVDNGFNLSHPELKDKVVMPFNVWKHSNEIYPQEVDHGTHVAGTALAIADNGIGISGIAPNCKFIPIQVANEQGIMTTTTVLDGILYALYQGADVINISLGTSFYGLDQYPESEQKNIILNRFKEEERLWKEVMKIADSHNSTIVVAAGNDNVLAGIEALQRPENFIVVSATDKRNRNLKAKFSNYGKYSKISAPGVGIYSTVGNNDYQIMDGTSMAAPIVTGAIALMKSLNDTITTKQIICILKATGLHTQGRVGRFLQLDKALERVKNGELENCTPVPTSGDVQVLLEWNNYNDLDLICIDPMGDTVYFKNKNVPSGGQLEIDMNVKHPGSKTPIENIYWPDGTAPFGTYNVYLLYYKQHEPNKRDAPYIIKVKYDIVEKEYKGVIKDVGRDVHICKFILGNEGNVSQRPITQQPESPTSDDRRIQLEQERKNLVHKLDSVNNELGIINKKK